MKFSRLLYILSAGAILLFTQSCSDGGGSAESVPRSGIVSMSITDAKPMLPANITSFRVKIDQVLVHKSGGGWKSLPLAMTPYEVDLLQFINGLTTELVPAVRLEYGKYTQVRMIISEAWITVDEGPRVATYQVEIPPGHLKTDQNFLFDVQSPAAVNIVVDFDLSMSLKENNSTTPPTYQCKPVLHLVDTFEAATIYGDISDTAFVSNGGSPAYVTVFVGDPIDNEIYTKIEVKQTTAGVDESFEIFWLVPEKTYCVAVDFDQSSAGAHYSECIRVSIGEEAPLKGDPPTPI